MSFFDLDFKQQISAIGSVMAIENNKDCQCVEHMSEDAILNAIMEDIESNELSIGELELVKFMICHINHFVGLEKAIMFDNFINGTEKNSSIIL